MSRLALAFCLLTFGLWQRPGLSAACSSTIQPGDSIQAAVDCSPPGTTFTIKAGMYRMQSIQPKDNDSFNGEPGAILSGARLLNSFTKQGNYWVAGNQTQQGPVHGGCDEVHPRCDRGEDLFLDDKPLFHVDSLSKVTAGKYFFDYDRHAIFMSDNPAGHRLETSVTLYAFTGPANGVTIAGLIIEKYANQAQTGAVEGEGKAWTMRDLEVRWNHGAGIHLSTSGRALSNYIHNNGQHGIHGVGNNILVENNELASNNYAGFAPGWEAGGAKFAASNGVIFRSNYVHDNKGPGLWTDIDCINIRFERNLVVNNANAGITQEIGYDARILNNTVKGNGTDYWIWLWGAQILVQNSQNVEVAGNIVETPASGGNAISLIEQKRGSGAYGAYLTRNNSVHDNEITWAGPYGATGAVSDNGSTDIFKTNSFDNNTYFVNDPAGRRWAWNGDGTWSAFQAAGQETHGRVLPLASKP